ncbi:glycosyltransferase involved in cell wall biosynthesis [Microvirga lupini]|uniref:Glycosyltransferase involved in cell wall biosynthesis n=1 Tax=Microvirga lupini TaxID=420324 RepID=A0A7W4YWZ6_9HYPH|nr:glycosyltransferase family 4 protein [Microvirga lupini]MBB3018709.1 glycosyltransferase involved in cell wall biosynthesis [Microvirga lupini]
MTGVATDSLPPVPFKLRTIVHLVQDVAKIGGIPGRVRNTIASAQGRPIQHICLSARRDPAAPPLANTLYAEPDEAETLAFLATCHATDTVVITPNSVIRAFSPAVREQLTRLPLLHMASGQLAFILQDSDVLAHLDFVDTYKVSRILCLSDMDMSFHRQMGIHDLTKIRLPVATRATNGYSPATNRFVTYVGRIDFHAKGAERLVPVARLMQERGLGRLRIFTTDGPNSPDLPAFLALLDEAGVSDGVEIIYNVTDKPALYSEASVVLLPSKKESFGNVILEAFSFGVPVMATSYAPGPAEVIRHGEDGFLLDEFSAEAVVALLESLTPEKRAKLSRAAFARHHDYSMEQYLASLETIAADTALAFEGKNRVRAFPHVRATENLRAQIKDARRQIRLLEKGMKSLKESYSWRITEPLRLIKSKLSRNPQG